MLTCKFFNFPTIPAELIAGIVPGNIIGTYPPRTCTLAGQSFETSNGEYYYINKEIDEWVRSTVPVDIDFVGIRYQYGNQTQRCHGAHSDATRTYGLLYTLDHGNGYLQFWKDPTLATELDRGYLVQDYNNLEKLEKIETPNNAWYLVNGQIIHSVEDLTRTRVTLQVNLKSLKGIEI